jgi:hypothetical protein
MRVEWQEAGWGRRTVFVIAALLVTVACTTVPMA